MNPSLADQIQSLLDKYGWAALLYALAEVARADGFESLTDALAPMERLINDSGGNGKTAG